LLAMPESIPYYALFNARISNRGMERQRGMLKVARVDIDVMAQQVGP
jgi:hypothetical protein